MWRVNNIQAVIIQVFVHDFQHECLSTDVDSDTFVCSKDGELETSFDTIKLLIQLRSQLAADIGYVVDFTVQFFLSSTFSQRNMCSFDFVFGFFLG